MWELASGQKRWRTIPDSHLLKHTGLWALHPVWTKHYSWPCCPGWASPEDRRVLPRPFLSNQTIIERGPWTCLCKTIELALVVPVGLNLSENLRTELMAPIAARCIRWAYWGSAGELAYIVMLRKMGKTDRPSNLPGPEPASTSSMNNYNLWMEQTYRYKLQDLHDRTTGYLRGTWKKAHYWSCSRTQRTPTRPMTDNNEDLQADKWSI